jgi:hypothetical protein
MSFKKHFAFPFFLIFILSIFSFAQDKKFEGYNIILDVPETQKSATCAIRYAPPTATVRITDLDRSTPFKVKSCDGSGSNLTQSNATSATLTANRNDFKWCFQGEDKTYRIEFDGDQYARKVSYVWPTDLAENNSGIYNIKDFGAAGDGRTDDTNAIHSALAYIATKNGGTLRFPEGDYIVGGVPDFKGIALPSGIVIEGVSGLHTGASTNNVKRANASRITLKGSNRAIFRIGECMEQITIKDLELYAESSQNTYGVEALGAYTTSQGMQFERVSFNNFFRGIQVQGLPQTSLQWQFDYVKIKDSRFIFNTDAGLYCNTKNSDWKIEGGLFVTPRRTNTQNANAMHFERIGMVLIEDTFSGGFYHALGGTFINVLDSGNLTVIGSQVENMTNSFVYNEVENPYAGDYTYPVTFINSIFDDPIIFKARRTFVSVGSFYGPQTFRADERVRVYSTGDRFCYDGATLACRGATKNNFDKATVIFMTGQPEERNVPGHPTFFGTDVEFGAPVKMPTFRSGNLPNGKPNGSMVYCEDCSRDQTPCRGGGSGAPAMMVGGRWSCL